MTKRILSCEEPFPNLSMKRKALSQLNEESHIKVNSLVNEGMSQSVEVRKNLQSRRSAFKAVTPSTYRSTALDIENNGRADSSMTQKHHTDSKCQRADKITSIDPSLYSVMRIQIKDAKDLTNLKPDTPAVIRFSF